MLAAPVCSGGSHDGNSPRFYVGMVSWPCHLDGVGSGRQQRSSALHAWAHVQSDRGAAHGQADPALRARAAFNDFAGAEARRAASRRAGGIEEPPGPVFRRSRVSAATAAPSSISGRNATRPAEASRLREVKSCSPPGV